MIAAEVADLGEKIIIGSFFFTFIALIIRDIVLKKRGIYSNENDKVTKIIAFLYAFIFIGTCIFMIVTSVKDKNNKQQQYKYDESIYQYDSPIKEHVEGIGMQNTYKSKEYKRGDYKKGSMQLSYVEDTNSYVYILSDSPNVNEVDFSDHDYIISYFFDISKGTAEQIYKYINLCIENELPPSITIYKNNTSVKITYDYYHDAGTKKVEYVFTKYVNRDIDIEDSLMIYHYGMKIDDDTIKLIHLIFGDKASFNKKEYDESRSYIIK